MGGGGGETTAAAAAIRKPYTLPNHPSTSHQLPSLPNTIPQICSHLHRLIQSQTPRHSLLLSLRNPLLRRGLTAREKNLPRPLLRRRRQHRHDQIIPPSSSPSSPPTPTSIGSAPTPLTASQLHTRTGSWSRGDEDEVPIADRRGELRGRRGARRVSGSGGAKEVVAQSFARIFFRNAVATGEVYPLDAEVRVCKGCRTGDVATVELREEESVLINHTTGKEYRLKAIGDAGPVIDAGGIFAYARKAGMIPSAAA
ncbi:hypothetical protein Bca52824_025307 [Brassica carinata]|uniref:Aconitase A/isopropylmalate dehydratase small subunit swivel domain-containing protein n=1 Tax=Brassica carinata TaxID=52824 RepID=A0A8X8AVM3_BRACI|nr:hypothetical protein Bca52824_025307 [Brassica carinata]